MSREDIENTYKKVLYIVVWNYEMGWDIDPLRIDSVWTDRESAERRLELLKSRRGENLKEDYNFGVFAVPFNEMKLLESAGVADDEFGRSLINL